MELGPIQKRWIEELRSGRFKQGKEKLCRDPGDGVLRYCCLGVLCYVMSGKPNESEDAVVEEGVLGVDYMWCGKDDVLPESIMVEAGLHSDQGDACDDHRSLVAKNDAGWTFQEIADELEEHPERYFERSA